MATASRGARPAPGRTGTARPPAAAPGAAPGAAGPAADHAVTVLYHRHYAALVREAALLVGDAATAEDVVQDCFIALHRAWWRVRDAGSGEIRARAGALGLARRPRRHSGP